MPIPQADFKYVRELNRYRATYLDGERLKKYCFYRPKIEYPSMQERIQAKRNILNTLQFYGLQLSMNAITEYSKKMGFTEDTFVNMVDKLVGGYCSKNITFIGHDSLRKYFQGKFSSPKVGSVLPSIDDNFLFSDLLRNIETKENIVKKEFLHTVKLFRALCSWGNNVENLRLLVPIVRNPIIMAHISRVMNNEEADWNPRLNQIVFKKKESSTHMRCDYMMCRKSTYLQYKKKFPTPIGQSTLTNDIDRLFCDDFYNADFTYVDQSPQVAKWISEQDFDEHTLIASQFIALITKIPDFLIWGKEFKDGLNAAKTGMAEYVDSWALNQVFNFSHELFFEEPLNLEMVDISYFYDPYDPNLRIVFDVNLGEFDKNVSMIGKIKVKFKLDVDHNILVETKSRWDATHSFEEKQKENIKKVLSRHIEDSVTRSKEQYLLPTWNKGLINLVVENLLEQLQYYRGVEYSQRRSGKSSVVVEINYAPFALKYLFYKRRTGTRLIEEY